MTLPSIINPLLLHRPQGSLYHYTSQAGALGILASKEIWATHIHYLNDSSEFNYAKGLASFIVEEAIKTETDSLKLDLLREMFLGIQQSGINVCVASFSEVGDQLSQWRGYCKKGGCSIGLSYDVLSTIANREEWLLAPCVYNQKDQADLMQGIIAEVLSYNIANHEDLEDRESRPGGNIAYYLNRLAPIFKGEAFSEEKEWRLISVPLNNGLPEFCFREGPVSIVPYYKLKLYDELNPFKIEEIIVSPSSNQDLSYSAIKQLLVKNMYTGTIIKSSQIPYRDWP